MKNPYSTLGITKFASKKEIKKAYRNLAKEFHPDKNKDLNATEKFSEIVEAYEILSDSSKKKNFDTHGSINPPLKNHNINDIFKHFDGSFNDVFNKQKQRVKKSPYRKQSNLKYKVVVDLEFASKGGSINVEVEKLDHCSSCNGVGASAGIQRKTCEHCKGEGSSTIQQGFFAYTSECGPCRGHGTILENPCKPCMGKGLIKVKKDIKVNIPKGIATGNTLRIKGFGNAGPPKESHGDLFLDIHVKDHKDFKRVVDEIHTNKKITIAQATLGDVVEIKTLLGSIKKVVIREGTQHGTKMRLKGEGLNGKDHIVTINIVIPTSLTIKQRELMEQFYKEENHS